jgi:tetratricopeptide (TPR) repeat protein
MILYRAVALQELALIYDSEMKAFPARLPQQPIFYPVLDLEYARQIASDWNVKSGQYAGYVTEFKVEDKYIRQFEKHTVKGSQHQELWIPAEEMEKFNQHIVGHIKVLEAHFGKAFKGFIPEKFGLQGKNAVEQFTLLANSYVYKRMDFYLEIKRNHKAIFLNYPFWQKYKFKNPGLKEKVLQEIKEAWLNSFPKIPLPVPPPVQGETPPLKQTPAKVARLVDPVQEEITPIEESDAQHWEDPVDEETTPEEETDEDAPHWTDPVDEEIKPIKQTPARVFVKSFAEEVTPEEETDEDAQDLVDLADEEITTVEQTPPPVVATPVRKEIPPEKQTPAQVQPLIDAADDEITAIEEADSLADLLDEENTPLEESDFDSLDDLIEEDSTSEEETDEDAQHLEDLAHEEVIPIEQTPPDVVGIPVRKEITPVERTDSPVWVNPMHQESTHPKQTASHLAQGIKLGVDGKYREATQELSKAVEEDPQDVVAQTSLGVAFHRLGEDDRALPSYEEALQIDPNDAEAHYFRANILYTQGNIREAIAEYTIAIGLDPALIEAHRRPLPQDRLTDYNDLPAGMYRIAKPAHRILDLNKSLEANPRQAKFFKERAAEYSRLWNFERAITDYSSSLALQPKDASALHSRGVAYEQMGQHDRAREDYQQALAIDPSLSDVYIHRGVTFGKMGNLRQSIDNLTEGIRLAPKNPDGYFNRGASYFQLGDWERAIADFSTVIRLSPSDETAYYWRGISNENAGHQDQAIADYRQFLAISQDSQAREEIEGKLNQWNQGKRNGVSSQSAAPEERQKTTQVEAQKPDQDLDLHALVVALGDRALHSTWFGSGVECYGENAEELFSFTDYDRPIEGREFLRITSGIDQTIEGDFTGFDAGATSHWILIRAWEGSGFYIEINDPKSKEQLKTHFQSVEEVEGAYPPYEGLFIRI